MNKSVRDDPGVLLALRGNEPLQLMIAFWPRVDRSFGAEMFDHSNQRHRPPVARRWAAFAGLREIEVRNLWDQAFVFCRDDGSVDEIAARYVATLGLVVLPREMRPVSKPEAKP